MNLSSVMIPVVLTVCCFFAGCASAAHQPTINTASIASNHIAASKVSEEPTAVVTPSTGGTTYVHSSVIADDVLSSTPWF
jgi:hypothetical protein